MLTLLIINRVEQVVSQVSIHGLSMMILLIIKQNRAIFVSCILQKIKKTRHIAHCGAAIWMRVLI